MITLKEIAGYLPYKLQIYVNKEVDCSTNGEDPEYDEIAGIIPIGRYTLLALNTIKNVIVDGEVIMMDSNGTTSMCMLESIKPIFHPPSDLIKPCLEGGKIPIVVLANIHDKFTDELFSVTEEKDERGIYYMCHYLSDIDNNISCHFVIAINPLEFQANALFHNSKIPKYEYIPVNNQLQLFSWLYEHHFWLGDQSRFGKDIIDINSIK